MFSLLQFVDGEPDYHGCCRTNIGGYQVTDYLKQLLSLKYPQHTWVKFEIPILVASNGQNADIIF